MRIFPDNTEKDLYRLLVDDYGFKEKLESYPINRWNRIRKRLGLKYKSKTKAYDMWLTNEIDGKVYEIILIDIWYALLKIDDVPVFNKVVRFERESLLKHIPVPYHIRGSVASESLGIL